MPFLLAIKQRQSTEVIFFLQQYPDMIQSSEYLLQHFTPNLLSDYSYLYRFYVKYTIYYFYNRCNQTYPLHM